MGHLETDVFGWDELRDAEGKRGGVGRIVSGIVEATTGRELVDITPLAEVLFIPGVLCSATPRVIRSLLAVIPKATARTRQDLLSVIFCLSEILSAPHQESIASHSVGAILPYKNYEVLRQDLVAAIETGEELYKMEFANRPRNKVTDREFFAAALLAECPVVDPTLLQIYDNAIAVEHDLPRQALLFRAAVKVADQCGNRTEYLTRYLHQTGGTGDFSVPRLLAASYLAETLNVEQLKAAFGNPEARRSISLPDTLAALNSTMRYRIFKTIFLSGTLHPGEPLLYSFELLRSAFDSPARHDGLLGYLDSDGYPHTDFRFVTSPSGPRRDFHPVEREALRILANCNAVWTRRSNLWTYFGLPDSRDAIRRLGES